MWFAYLLIIVVALCLNGLLASMASDIAQEKGYEKRTWFHMSDHQQTLGGVGGLASPSTLDRKSASPFGAFKRGEAPVRRFLRSFARKSFITRMNGRENGETVRPVSECKTRQSGLATLSMPSTWFHMCFWLCPISYVIVAAMPDRIMQEKVVTTNKLHEKLIDGQNAVPEIGTLVADEPGDANTVVYNHVKFGTYQQNTSGEDSTPIEWLVLACDSNKALLISCYGLDVQPLYKSHLGNMHHAYLAEQHLHEQGLYRGREESYFDHNGGQQ